MMARVDLARQDQAAQAHAAHEGREQDGERDRRRPDDELQQLQPHDLIDERGAAAAREQQDEGRQIRAVAGGLRTRAAAHRNGNRTTGRAAADRGVIENEGY
jgi:hypothetical protein